MTINDQVIDKLSRLSSLEILEENKEDLKKDLTQIVSFVDNLNDVNVDGVDATSNTIEGGTFLREDDIRADNSIAQDILNNAPKSEDGYFIVPKIIE